MRPNDKDNPYHLFTVLRAIALISCADGTDIQTKELRHEKSTPKSNDSDTLDFDYQRLGSHMTEERKQSEYLADYRKWLVAAEQKSQEDFDKTILSLSGGALGISFVFLKDVIGPHPISQPNFLLIAWLAWAFSTFSVLISYYLSHLALRRAISQVDNQTIYEQQPGGAFAGWTAILNAAGAVLFLAGVCCITVFAGSNLSLKGTTNDRKETSTSTIPAGTPTSPAARPSPGQSSAK